MSPKSEVDIQKDSSGMSIAHPPTSIAPNEWPNSDSIDSIDADRSLKDFVDGSPVLPPVESTESTSAEDVTRASTPGLADSSVQTQPRRSFIVRLITSIFSWVGWIAISVWRIASLTILLAIAATIPIVQLASLGYLLEVASRIAKGYPRQRILPGMRIAGEIAAFAMGLFVTWLPVWLTANFAYQAELVEPGSIVAARWRVAAFVLSSLWLVHGLWAIVRGGRWYHFLWPAPVRFFREFFQLKTWRDLEDRLWNYTVGLQIPRLSWLGLRASIGALVWLAVPALLVVIGMQANQQPGRFLLGIVGFFMMWWVLLHLPFLQVHMAKENRLKAIFDLAFVRESFKKAPWAFFFASLFTLALAIPLYLLRIEVIPDELLWLPCLFFVVLTLPAKMLVGWALARGNRSIKRRWWPSRYLAWTLQAVAVPIYILFLYLGSIASWEGPLVVFLQHAFLTPAPFLGP
jgi:hypothetical protein